MGALYPVACAVAVSIACSGAPDKPPVEPVSRANPVAIDAGFDAVAAPHEAIHSMVLFGTERTYLSHLALYEPPYDYQIVLEIRLRAPEDGGPDPRAIYVADKRRGSDPLYTLVPEPFEVEHLRSGTAKKPFQFGAGVYRGHFEHGGVNILDDVDVEVVRVLHFRKLDPRAPRSDFYRAILVGPPSEQFAVHYVGGRPSFQQIVAVSGGPAGEGIATAIARGDDEPLVEKSRVEVRLGEGKKPHSLRIDVDVYTDVAELGD